MLHEATLPEMPPFLGSQEPAQTSEGMSELPQSVLDEAAKEPQGLNVINVKPWIIYTLCDPETFEIRYVGITTNLWKRYSAHVHRRGPADNKHKLNWINNIKNKGLKPLLFILERGSGEIWKKREKYWISLLTGQGHRLTNISTGGDGGSGGCRTEEHKLALSRANKGRKLTPEQAKRAADAQRGIKRGPMSEDHYAKLIAGQREKLKKYTFNKLTMTLAEWCRHVGMKRSTVKGRIETGWTIEDAVFTQGNQQNSTSAREKISKSLKDFHLNKLP